MSVLRYPRYKDSGVKWLGKVPEHWGAERLDRLYKERREEPDENAELISAFINGQVTLRSNRPDQIIKNSGKEHGYKKICRGDLVISGMNAHLGGLGISDSDGKASPVYIVLTPLKRISEAYTSYLLRHYAVSGYIRSLVNTIRYNSADMKYGDIRNLIMIYPPLPEQTAIAAYLDRETAKIDTLVEEQEKLIALLKEKRQAVISHAVTKGLDPSVPMKDSGIQWLGKVPEHWDTVPLKTVISAIESGTSVNAIDTPALQGELGVLKVSCVYNGRFDPSENKTVLPEEVDRVSCPPRAGCLVVSRANTPDLVGSAGLVHEDYEGLFLSDKLWQVHFIQVEPAFVHYWTLASAYRGQVHLVCTGASASMQNISKEQFRQFVFLKPPLMEQKTVVRFLNRQTEKLDRLVNEAERAIELLKERRSALISAAVAGKIDVSGLVAEEVTA